MKLFLKENAENVSLERMESQLCPFTTNQTLKIPVSVPIGINMTSIKKHVLKLNQDIKSISHTIGTDCRLNHCMIVHQSYYLVISWTELSKYNSDLIKQY